MNPIPPPLAAATQLPRAAARSAAPTTGSGRPWRVPRTIAPRPGVHPAPDARAPRLVDAAPDAHERFRALSVAVVGAGGIGGRIALDLARAGVRRLLVVDGAALKPESLLTHHAYPDDLGRPKAEVVASRAASVAPACAVRYAACPFEALPLDALLGVDVVVLASDNLAAELAVAEATRRLGVRVVQAALYGPTLTAEVRSLANDAPGGPCLACAWAEDDWARLDAGTRFPCVQGADGRGAAPLRTEVATRTTVELCALAAALAFAELRRRVLGLALAPDVCVAWSGYALAAVETRIVRSAVCAADHARWSWRPWPDLDRAAPAQLAAALGLEGEALAGASLEVPGRRFPSAAAHGWREAPLDALGPAFERSLDTLPPAHGADAPSLAVVRVDGAAPTAFHRPRCTGEGGQP